MRYRTRNPGRWIFVLGGQEVVLWLTWGGVRLPPSRDHGRPTAGWHWPANARLKVVVDLVGDFQWLRPTKANLAALRVTVPPGFQQRHGGGLPVPGPAYTITPGR
jgi:hypothetical protein